MVTQPPFDDDQAAAKGGNPFPVDSATRPCCSGIGGHTHDCSESISESMREAADSIAAANEQIHPSGPFPSLRPIECASWCSDGDGHTDATARADQTCWGEGRYVELSLEEVEVNYNKGDESRKVWPSIIGPNAYRGHNQWPCVYLHFVLNDHGARLVDDSCKLTADEARQLAAHLVAVADQIEGGAR